MRFGRGARLFRKGLGATLLALLGLLFLASSAPAQNRGEINQQVDRCVALTDEAITLIEGVKINDIKDDQSKKKAVAKLNKVESNLKQLIDIYQARGHTSRNLGMAKQSLKQVQYLKSLIATSRKGPLKEKPLGALTVKRRGAKSTIFDSRASQSASATLIELKIGLRDLRNQTSQAQNLR